MGYIYHVGWPAAAAVAAPRKRVFGAPLDPASLRPGETCKAIVYDVLARDDDDDDDDDSLASHFLSTVLQTPFSHAHVYLVVPPSDRARIAPILAAHHCLDASRLHWCATTAEALAAAEKLEEQGGPSTFSCIH